MIPVGDSRCRFDHKVLEAVIKGVVQKELSLDIAENVQGLEKDENRMVDRRVDLTPTFVVATKYFAPKGAATVFRSYDSKNKRADTCFIWQAARATTAAPTYFPPITIDEPKPPASYIDGGLKHNNPSALAIEEAGLLWPTVKRFTLVSIGTGRQGLGILPELPMSTSIFLKIPFLGMFMKAAKGVAALKAMTRLGVESCTASEEVHERITKVANSDDSDLQFPYYRFDVDGVDKIELQEWKKIPELGEITTSYIYRKGGQLASAQTLCESTRKSHCRGTYVTHCIILFQYISSEESFQICPSIHRCSRRRPAFHWTRLTSHRASRKVICNKQSSSGIVRSGRDR